MSTAIPRPLPPSIDAQQLRTAFGRYVTGVTVVTFQAGEPRGITVNSFTSVSLEPPLALISIARRAASHDPLLAACFTVNVLGAEQEEIARHFAGRPAAEPQFVPGEYAPRLAGCLAYFECVPWATYDGGDHSLIVGEIKNFCARSGDALGYNGSQFVRIEDLTTGDATRPRA